MILLVFYCPHALADGNQCIRIREKTLEFSSAVTVPELDTCKMRQKGKQARHRHQQWHQTM